MKNSQKFHLALIATVTSEYLSAEEKIEVMEQLMTEKRYSEITEKHKEDNEVEE